MRRRSGPLVFRTLAPYDTAPLPRELQAFESTHSPQEGPGVHASVVLGIH